MKALVETELLKLWTTSTPTRFLLATLGLVALITSLTITQSELGQGPHADASATEVADELRRALSAWTIAGIVALVLGIGGAGGELQQGTITSTLLVIPDRGRVVLGKLIAYALAAIALGMAAAALNAGIALPWLASKGVTITLSGNELWLLLIGGLLGAALSAMLGVGLGSLLRSPAAAIALALLVLFAVEPALIAYLEQQLPGAGRFTPGQASAALIDGARVAGSSFDDVLPRWAGALVSLGYTAAFVALGTRALVRRDIT